MAFPVIPIRKMNGQVMEIPAQGELRTIRRLKEVLAKAVDINLPASLVGLIDSGFILEDDDEIPGKFFATPPATPMTLVVKPLDVGDFICKLEAEAKERKCNIGTALHVTEAFPDAIFDPAVAEKIGNLLLRCNQIACWDFFKALNFMVATQPPQDLCKVHSDGSTVVSFLVRLHSDLFVVEKKREVVEDILLTLLARGDLDMPLISPLRQTLRERHNGRSICRGSMKVADRMLEIAVGTEFPALARDEDEEGNTLLLQLLEPLAPKGGRCLWSEDKDKDKAALSMKMVTHLGLLQLCHRNKDGLTALTYLEQVREKPWKDVQSAIVSRVKFLVSSSSKSEAMQALDELQKAMNTAKQLNSRLQRVTCTALKGLVKDVEQVLLKGCK